MAEPTNSVSTSQEPAAALFEFAQMALPGEFARLQFLVGEPRSLPSLRGPVALPGG
jgi:hypothetical protein